ncbi:MAG: hypothetical protein ABW252_00945 [Polyangiales bacterium]
MPHISRIEVSYGVPRVGDEPTDDLPASGRLLPDDAFRRITALYEAPLRLNVHVPPHSQIDWEWVRHQVHEKTRRVLTDDQTLYLAQLMAEWVKLTTDLVDAAVAAEASASAAIEETSGLRQAQMALAGNVIWAVLTTAAPPPFGAICGAVVRGLLTQETWDKCFSVSAEWILQAPWPHTGDQADALGEWRPWVPGKNTNSPRLNYLGGHPTLRELKDYHKLLETVRDPLAPGARDVFDRLNTLTLGAARKLPRPPAQTSHFRETIHEHLTQKLGAIRTAVRRVIYDFGSDNAHALKLAKAVYCWLYLDDHPSRPPPSPRLGPQRPPIDPATEAQKRMHRVIHGTDVYLNTLADKLIADLARPLRDHRVPRLDVKAAQEVFECLFIARYLAEHREPPPTDVASARGEAVYRAADGVVPAKMLQGALVVRMQQLGIVRKFEGATFGFGRTGDYESAINGWRPPFPDGDWIAVPYQGGGANARGRLATWALNMRDLGAEALVAQIFKRCR